MSTFEQNIMTQLIQAFGNITVANGYSFTVGSNVWEWRDSPLDDNELPAIIIRDPVNETAAEDEKLHTMTVEVDIIDVGDASPASIRAKTQDALTAFSTITTYSPVTGAAFLRAEKEIDRAQRRAAGARLTFEIYYYAEPWII